jgi:hypothetical protein
MAELLVTIGTDGTKDWVETPDGQRFALGPVSVLSLVSAFSKNSRVARQIIDAFLRKGAALLSVDDDSLWTLLAPRRPRHARTGPFITRVEGHRFARPPMKTAFEGDLNFDTYRANLRIAKSILQKAEATVGTIDRLAAEGKRFNASRAKADVASVTTRVASICSSAELTESWVQDDLRKLAAWNDKLHGLFHPEA